MSKVVKKTILEDGTVVSPKMYGYVSQDTFDYIEEPVEVRFKPSANVEEALTRLPTDQSRALKLLNGILSREAMFEARASVESKGFDSGAVNMVFATFRNLPPYSDIKDEKEQTKAIAAAIRNIPGMVDSIKLASERARQAATESDAE